MVRCDIMIQNTSASLGRRIWHERRKEKELGVMNVVRFGGEGYNQKKLEGIDLRSFLAKKKQNLSFHLFDSLPRQELVQDWDGETCYSSILGHPVIVCCGVNLIPTNTLFVVNLKTWWMLKQSLKLVIVFLSQIILLPLSFDFNGATLALWCILDEAHRIRCMNDKIYVNNRRKKVN
ncbi:hypothetical protein CEXT_283941 [Caerostris extrusa]|uniref:Uncharacterized protein n=1 Tax=Caerostris extrusa TaxID=172846 RepID=A0AAV4XHP5_CAEEX|nr:hypothetical protein CEXT_283941 [Caerostris extrusa]